MLDRQLIQEKLRALGQDLKEQETAENTALVSAVHASLLFFDMALEKGKEVQAQQLLFELVKRLY